VSTANVPPSQPVDAQVLGRFVLPRKEVSVTLELGVVHTGVAVLNVWEFELALLHMLCDSGRRLFVIAMVTMMLIVIVTMVVMVPMAMVAMMMVVVVSSAG